MAARRCHYAPLDGATEQAGRSFPFLEPTATVVLEGRREETVRTGGGQVVALLSRGKDFGLVRQQSSVHFPFCSSFTAPTGRAAGALPPPLPFAVVRPSILQFLQGHEGSQQEPSNVLCPLLYLTLHK